MLTVKSLEKKLRLSCYDMAPPRNDKKLCCCGVLQCSALSAPNGPCCQQALY